MLTILIVIMLTILKVFMLTILNVVMLTILIVITLTILTVIIRRSFARTCVPSTIVFRQLLTSLLICRLGGAYNYPNIAHQESHI
jgi:hypothetical protein